MTVTRLPTDQRSTERRLRVAFAAHADVVHRFTTMVAVDDRAADSVSCQVFTDLREQLRDDRDADPSAATVLGAAHRLLVEREGPRRGRSPSPVEPAGADIGIGDLRTLTLPERSAVAAVMCCGDGAEAAQVLAVSPTVLRADLRRGLTRLAAVRRLRAAPASAARRAAGRHGRVAGDRR